MDKKTTCFFTGHRTIRKNHIDIIEARLPQIISDAAKAGYTNFICGGALGFDTLAAVNVVRAKAKFPDIKLIIAAPCRNQTHGWSSADTSLYDAILQNADDIIYVSEEYNPGCMHKRNRFMADNSSLCVFYLTRQNSGTAYTVNYSLDCGNNAINILT